MTKNNAINVDLKVQPQFFDLYTKSWAEFALFSGRGAGKSWAVADYLIIQALNKKTRILCAREIQISIKDSVMKLLADRIEHYGLSNFFDIQKTTIICLLNSSEFIFSGLKHNINSIKSMEGIEIVWIEEAQTISHESLGILIPTVFRVKNAKIIYTYNPRHANDAVYERFNKDNRPRNSIVKQVSSEQNKYFTEAMKQERDFNFKTDPEVANHIWNGALCPTSSAMSVIPLNWLRKCVDAHHGFKYGQSSEYVGFDVADTGDDSCAIAHVKGSLVSNVVTFDNSHVSKSVDFVHNYCLNHQIIRVYFDATGVGAGVKSDFARIKDRNYGAEPFLGASKVCGENIIFTGNITNKDYFRNKKAQAWWAVRMRAENTIRLLDSENINPANCLFLSSNIANLDDLMLELSQASYKHDDGKLMVDKQPNGEKSPNMADAVVMAFARSIKNGLVAK